MKTLLLTSRDNSPKRVVYLDEDSYETAIKLNPKWYWAGGEDINNIGARTKDSDGKWVSLHRLAAGVLLNPHTAVIFKDGNRLNNLRSNLLLKSRSDQSRENALKAKENKEKAKATKAEARKAARKVTVSTPLLEQQKIEGLEYREAQLMMLVEQHLVPSQEVNNLSPKEKRWQKVAAALVKAQA
ncbi:Uncharacterised protein [uncultured archaeon]|nr:Uncharacterised protein [uncultured archaeon]